MAGRPVWPVRRHDDFREGPLACRAVTLEASLDVVGIGNALVDVLTHEDDAFLEAHGLAKGAMTLIGTDRAEELYTAMGPAIEMSGGSVGNSTAGIASFGGRAGYLGRVFADQLGAVFAHDLRGGGGDDRRPPGGPARVGLGTRVAGSGCRIRTRLGRVRSENLVPMTNTNPVHRYPTAAATTRTMSSDGSGRRDATMTSARVH